MQPRVLDVKGERFDITYAAHTASCTFLLDAEGICRQLHDGRLETVARGATGNIDVHLAGRLDPDGGALGAGARQAEHDAAAIRDALYRQAFAPVRWVETVQALPRMAQDLIAVGIWMGMLVGGLWALWYAHRERRI